MENLLFIFGFYFLPSYLVGSIPYGYIIGRLNGIDIRKHGSGNIGATNVWRIMGKQWGIPTFILDFLKAPVAFQATQWVFKIIPPDSGHDTTLSSLSILIFLGSVLGHNYPIWLKFKGGKGIATTAGGLLWLIPPAFGCVAFTWGLTFLFSRYVSLASIVSAILLPLFTWVFFPEDSPLIYFSCFLGAMAVWRHTSNIKNLINGTEHRWVPRKKRTPSEGGAS